jgi:effector-binding domain-containing protein
MKISEIKRVADLALAFGLLLVVLTNFQTPAFAQTRSAATRIAETTKAAPVSPGQAPATPSVEPDQQKAAPGVPSDATTVTLEVASKPVALLSGDGEWADGFKSILNAIAKVVAAIKTAGLAPTGRPFAVFLSTDETNFHFEAMVPIDTKPEGKTDLTDGVKLGNSPAGKAIKFLHRGAYEDIDSTYDLITAYLDEKGLEAKNLFVEEYLNDTKEPDDASLEADIYVFLK